MSLDVIGLSVDIGKRRIDMDLDELAFGRAHHRVLYFIDRNPGMTVAALLDILTRDHPEAAVSA